MLVFVRTLYLLTDLFNTCIHACLQTIFFSLLQIYLHVWNESTVMKVVYNSNPKNAILFVILTCLIGRDGDEFFLPGFPLGFTYSI